MTLSRADRVRLRSDLAQDDPTIFKRRLWARAPDERLLQYVKTLPLLSSFVFESKTLRGKLDRGEWAIGQGFQPADPAQIDAPGYRTTEAPLVREYPYLAATNFTPIALPKIDSKPWPTATVRRGGFAEGFTGPHILIPQGLERSMPRLRAAYTEQDLCFEDSLQAITFPTAQRDLAKLLTAVLNSSLSAWFYFHETANFGTDRAKVQQTELLRLPFAPPSQMPDSRKATAASEKILALINREIKNAGRLLRQQGSPLDEVDQLVCEYYGLDAQETALVNDTCKFILPAIQPRRSAGLQAIWDNSRVEHREAYARMLSEALKPWIKSSIGASLAARSTDIAIIKLSLKPSGHAGEYIENSAADLEPFLKQISARLPIRLPGNVQLMPDLRFVIGDDLYLVKPMQLRYWLRSTALADAEQIAAELNAALAHRSDKDAPNAGG
jgi:hypothetical protein